MVTEVYTPVPAKPAATGGGVSPYLSNTLAFLDLINGSSETKSSSGESKTTGTDISSEGIQALMQQMMEGTGGLADLATGAHAAGMYNDTTKTLLAQNLMAKIAGTAAQASAKTTTTTTPSTTTTKQNPAVNGQSIGKSLLLTGATALGAKLAKKTGILEAIGLGDDSGSAFLPAGSYSSGAFAGPPEGMMGAATNVDAGTVGSEVASALSGASMANEFASEAMPAVPSETALTVDQTPTVTPLENTGGDLTSSVLEEGTSSAVSDASDSMFGDLFDGWFAKGGKVGQKNSSTRMGYAEGGLVNVNKGTPTPITPAYPLNDPVSGVVSTPTSLPVTPTTPSITTGATKKTSPTDEGTGSEAIPASPSAPAPSAHTVAQIGMDILTFAGNPVLGLANAGSQIVSGKDGNLGKGVFGNALSALIGAFSSDSATSGPPGGGMSGNGSAGAGNSGAEMSSDAPADAGTTAGDTSGDVGPGGDPGGGGYSGDASGDPGVAGGGMGDAGSGDSGDGYATGGVVDAPGDGTVDTRMIKAADGEFVINAQAAKAIGYDKLNWLNTILGGKAA